MSSINSKIKEVDCYNKIIDCFLKSKNDPNKKENCKNQSIIKLMGFLKIKEKRLLVENALILVLSLFNGNDKPDLYSNIGQDIEKCDDLEKGILISELKKEFL